MSRPRIVIDEYFALEVDEGVKRYIYNPPLLAKTRNLRIELRQEKNHSAPHVHVIKKGSDGVSIIIEEDNIKIVAGESELEHFDEREFEAVVKFLVKNQNHLREIYKKLRGSL